MNTPLRSPVVWVLVIVAAVAGYVVGQSRSPGKDNPAVVVTRQPAPVAAANVEQMPAPLPNVPTSVPASGPVPVAEAAAAARGAPKALTAIEKLNALAEAQKLKTVAIRMTVIDRGGALNDGFTKLFAMTPAEKESLNRAVSDARAEIERLSKASTVVKRDGDSLVISTNPFDGGSDVYDHLMDSFAQTLGPERNAAFLALNPEQLGTELSAFGGEKRTITLSRELTENGEPRIAVRDERKTPHGSSSSNMQVPNTDMLLKRNPTVAPYLDELETLPVRPSTRRGPPGGR
jgi:hypothetical protein